MKHSKKKKEKRKKNLGSKQPIWVWLKHYSFFPVLLLFVYFLLVLEITSRDASVRRYINVPSDQPKLPDKYVQWAAPSLAFGSYEGVVRETATENVRACKGTKKRATKNCNLFCNIAENELNSDVARFTTHIKHVLQQIRLITGLNVGGETRNIAIQLVLQQCCKTSCTFFVARFSIP